MSDHRMERGADRSTVIGSDPIQAHYMLGWLAGCLGAGFDTCPYANASENRLAWIRGYTAGIQMITRIRKERRAAR